jgi:hypothetical protein
MTVHLRLVLFVCICLMAIPCPAQTPPSTPLESLSIDFGTIDASGVTMRKAVFRNTLDHPVTIARVYAGCGCFSTKLISVEPVPPGGEREIHVLLDPSKAHDGRHEYELSVQVLGTPPSVFTGKLSYTFDHPIDVSATELRIDADADHPGSISGLGSASVRFVDRGSPRLVIESVVTSTPDLETSMLDVVYTYRGTPTHTIEVLVFLPPGWPIGPINEWVEIKTNSASLGTLRLPVRGEVRGPIDVRPPRVVLNGMRTGTTFSRDVRLISPTPIIIGQVVCTPDTIRVEVSPKDPSKEVTLKISDTLDPSMPQIKDVGRYMGCVKLEILGARKYWQTIDVSGFVEKDK